MNFHKSNSITTFTQIKMIFIFLYFNITHFLPDPPKRTEPGPITIFGLKLGAEGRLNVTVRANPPPYVEWTVGDQRLTPLRVSEDGTITALEPEALVSG